MLGILLSILGLILSSAFLTAGGLVLFGVTGVTWLWNEFSLFGVHYTRSLSERRAFLGETVELTLTVANRKFLPLSWLTIVDVVPLELQVGEARISINRATNLGEFRTFWMLNPFQRSTRRFVIQCSQRGFHNFGPAVLNTGDGFGFFDRQATLTQIDRLIVYPRIYTVEELGLPPKNPFGERRSEAKIFEDPMRTVGVREWQYGDELKRVHWKATARHQTLLSRVFEPSEEQQAVIFLNAATFKRHWQGKIPELFERAISVAGSLAALAVEQRTPVGLITNGVLPASDQPVRLLPGRNPEQLMRILEMLAAVTEFTTSPIEELILEQAPRLSWGATLVVVTAVLYDELLISLMELTDVGRRVVLFLLTPERPSDPIPLAITVYHLPHLVNDVVRPQEIQS